MIISHRGRTDLENVKIVRKNPFIDALAAQ